MSITDKNKQAVIESIRNGTYGKKKKDKKAVIESIKNGTFESTLEEYKPSTNTTIDELLKKEAMSTLPFGMGTKLTDEEAKLLDEWHKENPDWVTKNVDPQQPLLRERIASFVTGGLVGNSKNNAEEKEDDIPWYKKILKVPENMKDNFRRFEDGYDFGDVTKTLGENVKDSYVAAGSSILDLGSNAVEGFVGIGETAAALIGSGVAQVSDWAGQEEYAEGVRRRIAGTEETILGTKGTAPINYYIDKFQEGFKDNSAAGYYVDEVAKGVGQIGGYLAGGKLLGKAGNIPVGKLNVPTTALISGGGSAAREVYRNEDLVESDEWSDDAQAWAKILGSGAIEGISEGLFGLFGVGGSEFTDQITNKAVKKMTSSAGKVLAKAGVSGGFELGEEFISYAGNWMLDNGIVNNLGEVDMSSDWDWGEVGEQMALAFVSSGITQGGGSAIQVQQQSNETIKASEELLGRELTETEKEDIRKQVAQQVLHEGNTENEQAVLDKVVEKRYNEEIKDNQDLSTKELKKIRQRITDEVQADLEKGLIDTADIESTLGGDTYTQLQKTIEDAKNWQKEATDIENKPYSELTVKDKERLDSLRAKLNELKVSDTQNKLEMQLQLEMGNKIAYDNNLKRSYYERDQKSRIFEVTEQSDNEDIKNWDKSFVDAKSNNSQRAHSFNEFGKKIIQDKNIKMRAVNYETLVQEGKMKKFTDENGNVSYKLKVNGEYRDVAVNGFKEKGVLNVNLQSSKVFEATVGHELGEFIKDSDAKMYDELKQIALELGKADGTYSEANIQKYADIYGENTDDAVDEYVNDKLGELFTNDTFIEQLSTKPNIIKKIINEIKHLVKMATAGSKEQRKLISLQHKLENKFKESYKNSDLTKDSKKDARFSLTTEQQEYFKDSKVRDENGNLKTMYHGTSNYGFTVFDYGSTKFGLFGQGFYFTDSQDVAESYTQKGKGDNQGVYEVYLNIKNPIDMDAKADAKWESVKLDGERVSDYLDVSKENATNEDYFKALKNYAQDIEMSRYEAHDFIAETIEGMGYDGIKHIGGGRFNKNDDTRHEVYIALDPSQIKNVDNTNPTDSPDIRYSLSEDTDIDAKINSSMTMEQAKRMIEMAFIDNRIYTWFDGKYENGDEWLQGEGIDEVETYLDNTISVLDKYLNPIYDKDSSYGDEYFTSDILQAYLNKTLTGQQKQELQRLDLSKDTGYKDNRFYAPQDIKGGQDLYNIASQRVTNANREQVYKARADFIINAHNKGYIESLGLKQYEVNRELKSWANYTKEAMDLSKSLNKGVARQNRWTGIENSSIVNTISISNEEMGKLVKEIQGDSSEWQRQYITSTMLALDTHIDYSNVTFKFDEHKQLSERNAAGEYQRKTDTILIGEGYQNTVAHEIGHYIDSRWARDLGLKNDYLSDSNVKLDGLTTEQAQFVNNFKEFINNISENSYMGSKYATTGRGTSYWQHNTEIFARFVARFVEWTKNKATNHRYGYEKKHYQDNFTERQYREFVKILQEKSMLDTTSSQYSLSDSNAIAPTQKGTRAEDVKLQQAISPLQQEINNLSEQLDRIESKLVVNESDYAPINEANVPQLEQYNMQNFATLDDDLAPAVVNDTNVVDKVSDQVSDQLRASKDLFETRDYAEVGNRKINAYQYDNPEVRPYFQQAAKEMLTDLNNSIKGERFYDDKLYYDTNGEQGFYGTTRHTTSDIAEMLEGIDGKYKLSYEDIRKGLEAIIEDHGAENNAASKRIEFFLDQRLRNGYTDVTGFEMPANNEYLNVVEGIEYSNYYSSIPTEVSTVPAEDVAPVSNLEYEAIEPTPIKDSGAKMSRIKTDEEIQEETNEEIAKILTEEPKTESDRNKRKWAIIRANVLDKGAVFENVSLKRKNRELMGKWDYTLTAESRSQNVIGQGHYEYDPISKSSIQVSKSLNDIRAEVENTGLAEQFYEYIYHKHNVDRMSLEAKAQEKIRDILRTSEYSHDELMKLANKRITKKTSEEDAKTIEFAKEYKALFDVKNKPVFGKNVTADYSQEIVNQYEFSNPEFMDFAQDVYNYVNADRQELVNKGVISQETADLWQEMYPHYVPIRRADKQGNAIDVPLDTGRTGINAPIKRAKGGNSDILPLFDTMAMRTLQTYRATARNSFGIELMNTIGTRINSQKAMVDDVIDSVDAQESLLQEGKGSQKPTFTVFEDGEKVTFEITKDMYDALKPLSDSSLLSKTFAVPNKISNFHRGVLTEYNPVFMLTNAIKDVQDILINSQHPAKTYAKIGEAYAQLIKKGYWYQEYMANGGEQNSYFDSQENTFKTENKGIKKLLDLPPLSTISKLNNFIEMTPRLAEYIASRESGRSIEVSMLDAARVTTNFKAGGNLTKFLNRNGATFLNASIQGAMQQVRNIREAKANGIRGWMNLATKFAIAGLPAVLLNAFMWDDDEDYEELADYVKQNYYIVWKTDEGKFIRIPKGRTLAVIQEAITQISNVATGNDEADLKSFIDLALTNLAPNNPIESNILSPMIQVATNKTWYGEDLVPTRLQDLPAAEQFDESTDAFSKWLGETLNISPVKINYLLDQYTGGVGDVVLPMMTPKAESGADTIGDKLLAPLNNKFTTDAVLNNQNVTDFYDTSEKLTTEAKKRDATDEDVLRNKYMNSVKDEMNELYQQKREVQNSDLSNSEKYNKVREIQAQINELAKEGLNNYENVTLKNTYSSIGDKEYHKDTKGEWKAVTTKEAKALNDLGMNANDKNKYFNARNNITKIVKGYEADKDSIVGEDEEYEAQVSYLSGEKKTSIIKAIKNAGLNDEQTAYLYDKYYASPEKLNVVVKTGIGMDAYLDLEAKNFGADYINGKEVKGSKKKKIYDYINSSNLGYEQKIILAKMYYTSDDSYNYEIIDYLNNDDSISIEDMQDILKALGFKVKGNTITWD